MHSLSGRFHCGCITRNNPPSPFSIDIQHMKRWCRASTTRWCGGFCNRLIEAGEPFLTVTLDHVKRALIRCQTCAGEPVPADIPAPVPAKVLGFTPVGALAFDWKAAAAGEREPGEEG